MERLTTKDLITVGIFSAIYLFIYIVLSSVLFTPLLFMMMLPIGALISGPVYMLYIARTQKPGAITIMGLLAALIAGLLVYGNIFIALFNFAAALVAEGLAYAGKYKSFKWNTASYCAVSLWSLGQQGGFWVARDWIRNLTITSGYPPEYADGVLSLATPTTLILIVVSTLVCAVISALVSNRMLKKHFKRAGIA